MQTILNYLHDHGLLAPTYTLGSVAMSGHAKYKRKSLACKMQEDSTCNTGDPAYNFIFLYLYSFYADGVYLYWPLGITLLRV